MFFSSIARFGCRISTQIRTVLFFLLPTTIGDIHGVGPFTFSIMSSSSRRFNSASTFLRI